MKNSLSAENRIPFIATVVGFDYQKEQASGGGWGYRYKIAIQDWYSSSTAEISDSNIEYAICILPCTAGSGGANRMQSARIVQGDIVTGYKIGGKRGVAFIDGVMPRPSLGGESTVKYGPGRFDAKSGFWNKNQPKNILGPKEICDTGVCVPKATNKSSAGGSGNDKSEKRQTPNLQSAGIDPEGGAQVNEVQKPTISESDKQAAAQAAAEERNLAESGITRIDANTFDLGNGTTFELE